MKKLSFIILLILSFATACKKNNTDTTAPDYGTFAVHFEHVFGPNEVPFDLQTQYVHPMTGDTLTFSMLKYYVSNIKLKKADGTWWSEPNSYHLVNLSVNNGTEIEMTNIPAGTYTELSYTLGVDSIRNVSGLQEGALSVTEGMFWSWNTGYIMVKAEGTSPQAANNSFLFHLGGFSGTDNIVTTKTTNFNGETFTVSSNKTPEVHINVNPAKLWHSSPSVSVTNKVHMPGAAAKTMADNFYGSFTFFELHP